MAESDREHNRRAEHQGIQGLQNILKLRLFLLGFFLVLLFLFGGVRLRRWRVGVELLYDFVGNVVVAVGV